VPGNQGDFYRLPALCYGPDDWVTVAWYKEKYHGFTDEQSAVFEVYSNGMTPKQHQNMLKKAAAKSKKVATFSR